jgi:hypothetical protein
MGSRCQSPAPSVYREETTIEIIFELLLELRFEVIPEIAFTLGGESLAHAMRRRPSANPVLAGLSYAIIGALAGGVSVFIIPRRMLPKRGVRGASLVLAPLVTGLLMKTYGD